MDTYKFRSYRKYCTGSGQNGTIYVVILFIIVCAGTSAEAGECSECTAAGGLCRGGNQEEDQRGSGGHRP